MSAAIAAFTKLKKKFTKHLKKPEQAPTAGFMEMGEYDHRAGAYASEGDYNVLVDPEGDAWVFLGPHEALARQMQKEGAGKR